MSIRQQLRRWLAPLPRKETAHVRAYIDAARSRFAHLPYAPYWQGDFLYALCAHHRVSNALEVGFATGSTALYLLEGACATNRAGKVTSSECAGRAILYDDVNAGRASSNAGVASLSSFNAAGTGVEVALSTIDEYVEGAGLRRVDLIKLDIQGAELPALRGARRTLERWRPTIMMEFDQDCATSMGWSRDDLMGFFDLLGYAHRQLDKDNYLFWPDSRSGDATG